MPHAPMVAKHHHAAVDHVDDAINGHLQQVHVEVPVKSE